MKISEIDFLKLIPAFMKDDEAIIALSTAVNELMKEPGRRLHSLRTWDKIDELTAEECDALAWELDIDWYDSSMGLAEKRETIKFAQQIRRKRGTKWAVESLITAYFGEGYVMEWYEMSGKHDEPYSFVVLTTNPNISEANYTKFIEAANAANNARSIMASVYYYWHERAAIGYNLDCNLHRYEYKKCGTINRAATIGFVIRESVEAEPEVTAHGYKYTKSGDHLCGTYPRAAVLGTVHRTAVAANITSTCSAYRHIKSGTQICRQSNPLRALGLKDRTTGKNYALYVEGGKLRMRSTSGNMTAKDAYFTDLETGADYVVYIAGGKLYMSNTAGVASVNTGIFDDITTYEEYALYVAGGKLRLKINT